jgi:beta-barrel assembly-enhancing protease
MDFCQNRNCLCHRNRIPFLNLGTIFAVGFLTMKNFIKLGLVSSMVIGLITLASCKDENGKINIFSINDDISFGQKVSAEFEADPANFILDSATNVATYKYVYNLRDSIIKTGKLTYGTVFPWRIRIIKDTILNAFCTPGGYIYVYTGLMKYLESEDQLAGVMGHEMAHADKRHSTEAMTQQYGLQTLLDIVFGQDKGQLARIAAGLKSLQFSRKNESQADEFSVIYLYETAYNAKGAAGFFQKIIDQGSGARQPEFLSTHPSPDNRVAAMTTKWTALGGKVGQTFTSRYINFKNSLP